MLKGLALDFAFVGPVIGMPITIRGGFVSLRVNGVIDLGELPETELQLDLVLHVHDEGEGLDELRGSDGSTLG